MIDPSTALPPQVSDNLHASALSRIYDLLRFVVAATAIILAVWLLSDVLTVLFAAALLAVILHGVASLLTRYARLPPWLALTLVVVGVIVVLAGLGVLAGPGLGEQAVKLRQTLTEQAHSLHDHLSQSQWGQLVLQQMPFGIGGGEKPANGTGLPTGIAGSFAGVLGSVLGIFGTIAVVFIASIYLAASPSIYVNGALRLVPVKHRPKAKDVFQTAGAALWAWSAGQALDMVVVGLVSGVGLWAIGVPLALVLGVLAGLTNFVPYIGAIVGAIPAVIIAFSVGTTPGLETMALYLVLQAFEGNIMAPMIQKRAVHLPPGLTILAQTAFGAILGFAGLIFATPLTAALLAVMAKTTTPLGPNDQV